MTSVGSAIRTGCAVVVAGLVLGGLVTACAKRPAMTQASAPPPTATAAPPAPQAIAPAAPTPPPAPAPAAPAPVAPAAPARPAPAQFAENRELGDVYFDFDKSVIRPRDARTLQANAEWLKRNPKVVVLIEGHCDERGTNEYNAALGERRADAARAFLALHGVDAGRISIISYGEERPTCTQHAEGCWAKNRRGHFLTKSE